MLVVSIRFYSHICSNEWDPCRSDAVIQLVEAWHPFLPEFIFENILEQLIMPKLQTAILSWSPKAAVGGQQQPQPLHAWLHPWLPILGHLLEPLYVIVRQKLAAVLQDWHPLDANGFAHVSPWRSVFSPKDMELFLVRNVVPKLTQMLDQEFKVNPRQQNLGTFR